MGSEGRCAQVKPQRWSCDFETTTNVDDCRVWAWAAAEVDDPDHVLYGNSLDSFMLWLCALPNRSTMWFHNLKFDGEFIYSWLFENGWEWVENTAESPIKTFDTLISDKGQHYCIHLNTTSRDTVEIRDSLKIIPMRVAEIPKAFGLPDAKLDLDYHGPREKGHELTEEERAYIREDVVIVSKALRIMLGSGMDRLTAGSNAMKAYKATVGGDKGFRKLYPVPDYDAEVRAAYRGGFTYADPRFRRARHRVRHQLRRELALPVRHENAAPALRRPQAL